VRPRRMPSAIAAVSTRACGRPQIIHALDLMTYFAGSAARVIAPPGMKRLGSPRVDYASPIALDSGIHAPFVSHWASAGHWGE
jgi:hypothetical protein